jgi:dephospho-CoA kinase
MLIGLTGGIGSGKSTVLRLFEELGAEVISADQITRQLMTLDQPVSKRIIEHFGESIIDQENNHLDRRKVRDLIFNAPHQRKWLEDLLHPLVRIEIQTLHAELPPGSCLIAEIPLLIEANLVNDVDRVLVVDCDEAEQINRVLKRDAKQHTSLELVQAIMDTQVSRETRRSQADDVLDNSGSMDELKKNLEKLYQHYIELSR